MRRGLIAVVGALVLAPPPAPGQGAVGTPAEGRLEPVRTVAIGAQVNGPVAQVLVEEGERVREGDLLARIEPARYRARLDEAEARVRKAKAVAEESARELERQQKIYDRGLSAAHDLEIAQRDAARDRAEVDAAQATARQARVDLGHTEIRAPMTGVVMERNVHPGETVIANLQPPLLFRLAAPLDRLDAVVVVGERLVAGLEQGQRVTVEFPTLEDVRKTGEVVRIARLPEEGLDGGARYPVRVRVPNEEGRLRPGMKARVLFQ